MASITCPKCGMFPCVCMLRALGRGVAKGWLVPRRAGSVHYGPASAYMWPIPSAESRDPERKLRGEVIGYRTWDVRGNPAWALYGAPGSGQVGLWSVGAGRLRWQPGANAATCRVSADQHRVPHHDCQCGFYAFHDAQAAIGEACSAVLVAGAVKAWGRIEVHEQGFRAEYAQVVAVAIPEHIRIRDPKLARTLRELALGFDASLVTLEELESAGREFGDPVPVEVRPKAKPIEYPTASVTISGSAAQFAQAMQKMQTAFGQIAQQQAANLRPLVRLAEQQQKRRRRARWWSNGFIAIATVNAAFFVNQGEWYSLASAIGAGVVAALIRLSARD